jgi:uncharacterized protein RhaS with RHS repeats
MNATYRMLLIVVVMLAWFVPTAHARWYDPTTGRWLQRDPIRYVDGMSQYEYVVSNPLKHVDPLGLHKQDNWYDLPSELKNNKEFRRFVECSKEGVELPKGYQISRKEMLELAEEWASDAKLDKSVRNKIGKALRGMKGTAGGLALTALGLYFLADDAAAAVTDKAAPCYKFFEAIKLNAARESCSESQLKTLGDECKWDLAERTAKTWGSAAGTRMEAAFDEYLTDVIEACRNHKKDCSAGAKGEDKGKGTSCSAKPSGD